MPLGGDIILATDVTRARPQIYDDVAAGALAGAQTDVDIPGISISFTTETASALAMCTWFMQAQNTSAVAGASINSRARITGPSGYVAASSVYAIWRSGAANSDQGTVGQQCSFALGAAGVYTVTLRGTTVANSTINIYTSMRVIVQEQWS